MKKLLKIGLLLILGFAGNMTCRAQSVQENLDVKEYIVEFNVQADDGDSKKSTYQNEISLLGVTYPNSTVKRFDLYFTLDDSYKSNKPFYNTQTNIASAYYPMSEFDKYYEMLKHNKNYLRASYRYSDLLKKTSIWFSVFGRIPMK